MQLDSAALCGLELAQARHGFFQAVMDLWERGIWKVNPSKLPYRQGTEQQPNWNVPIPFLLVRRQVEAITIVPAL